MASIGGIPTTAVSSWTTKEIKGISAQDIKTLTTEQVKDLDSVVMR